MKVDVYNPRSTDWGSARPPQRFALEYFCHYCTYGLALWGNRRSIEGDQKTYSHMPPFP